MKNEKNQRILYNIENRKQTEILIYHSYRIITVTTFEKSKLEYLSWLTDTLKWIYKDYPAKRTNIESYGLQILHLPK
jgi:hypothetical protein